MKPEEQRIAIAKGCPEKFKVINGMTPGTKMVCWWFGSPVDPLSDLNAMHEAEKVLTPKQWSKYTDWLLDHSTDEEYITEYQVCARATAAQRAEAFLRTLGLWKESEQLISSGESRTGVSVSSPKS